MAAKGGLVFGCTVEADGSVRDLDWDGVRAWTPASGGILWVHLEQQSREARRWLRQESALDPVIARALVAEETRPRSVPHREGLLVILRSVDASPEAGADDMVSLRMWIDRNRVISVRRRRVQAVEAVRDVLAGPTGPRRTGSLLALLAHQLVEPVAVEVAEVSEGLDTLEEQLLTQRASVERRALATMRLRAIVMRRHLAPQRDTLSRLQTERVGWLDDEDRLHLREVADRTTRFLEELEEVRERAIVAQEELASRLAEELNGRMFTLSVVAAIFLPLSFVTGLLGINVGGIPGAVSPLGFLGVCLVLGALGSLQLLLLRRLGWLGRRPERPEPAQLG
jgi:zinc transporter